MSFIAYPEQGSERTQWIVTRRGSRNHVGPQRPYAFLLEEERREDGTITKVATVFLTNRECPWKCVMCDLWRNTTPAPAGSIPIQIRCALGNLPKASVLKLYNSGSFFDSAAIPKSDRAEIAAICRSFDHVILECHPRLVGPEILEFARMMGRTLEIAMGLETAHPTALERLNKRISLGDFQRAAAFLKRNHFSVRAFLLVGVPFIPASEQEAWLQKSIHAAFDAGANVVSLIPTRSGNGALDALESLGVFREPTLAELESAHDYGLSLNQSRVFADTWDLERFSRCPECLAQRRERLERMNRSQQIEPRIHCICGN